MSTQTTDGREIQVVRVGRWPSEDPAWAEESAQDGAIFDGRAPVYGDLLAETATAASEGEVWELYEVRIIGADGYEERGNRVEALWLPGLRRAGVCLGGDSVWTYAESPADAVLRVLDGGVPA